MSCPTTMTDLRTPRRAHIFCDDESRRDWWLSRNTGPSNRHPALRVCLLAVARLLATDPTAGLERPKVPLNRTRGLTREQIAALSRRDDVSLRERALWRLLYETAARANEILSLDIDDLDLPNKCARVRSKGGATEWVFWQTGAALLLPRFLAGRTTGPVFVADRQPTKAVPSIDRCPVTGCARLSYHRAAERFSETTNGWTLHQLRHSALTHSAVDGINAPILLARSWHASVRSLERYARPCPEAVAHPVADTIQLVAVADGATAAPRTPRDERAHWIRDR